VRPKHPQLASKLFEIDDGNGAVLNKMELTDPKPLSLEQCPD